MAKAETAEGGRNAEGTVPSPLPTPPMNEKWARRGVRGKENKEGNEIHGVDDEWTTYFGPLSARIQEALEYTLRLKLARATRVREARNGQKDETHKVVVRWYRWPSI